MVLMRSITALFLVFFFTGISYAHQIVLKNGKIIESSSVIEKETTVSYQKYGGMIAIPRSDVKKIIYSKQKRKIAVPSLNNTQSPQKGDLVKQLEESKRPKNPIERANMCAVYIQTVAGAGSGFFVSDDGLIVTNRHVVRGDTRQKKQVAEKMKDTDQRLNGMKRKLEGEKNQINKYRQRLQRNWQESNQSEASTFISYSV